MVITPVSKCTPIQFDTEETPTESQESRAAKRNKTRNNNTDIEHRIGCMFLVLQAGISCYVEGYPEMYYK